MGRIPKSGKIDASSNNIPTSYGTGAGSLILTGLGNGIFGHIAVCNETAVRIKVATASSTPSSGSTSCFYVPATSNLVFDDVSISDSVFIESDGSTISAGVVTAQVW